MFIQIVCAAFFAFNFATAENSSSIVASLEFKGNRLPNDTKPISYNIHLTTTIYNYTSISRYSGVVTIALKVVHSTNEIVLHAGKSITVIKISLIDQEKGSEFGQVNYSRDSRNDFLTIFSEPEPLQLKKGKDILLAIYFNGSHEYYGGGFYKVDEWSDGQVIWIASTFFEPLYARTAFPCYDEPIFKAKFTVAITHEANLTALSNMPADGEPIERGDGMVTTKFKESPLMSVYTLGFLIGNYNNISVEIRNFTHRVFSLPSDISKGEFALDIASRSLHAFEDYFGIKYPLPKMDHVSTHQPAGAMENWGLIIYHTERLVESSNTSKDANLDIATTIAHEIALQWIGNLVTPKWWNYVWLNEALATFYSYKILEILHPDWKPTEYGQLNRCGDFWDTRETRPMSQYVEDETDVLYSFETIFQCKGAKMMHMFEHALTSSTLKKGVVKYLNKYQYSNVDENDLFECLQEAATEDLIPEFEKPGTVHKMMSSWTQQANFPRITVERDYSRGTFNLIQSPIETDGYEMSKNSTGTENQLWWIPITFATASNPNFDDTTTDFIFANEKNITINPSILNKTLLEDDWILLNKHQIGLYQVMYNDDYNWNLIIKALKKDPKVIPSYNKMQLIRDAGYLEEKSLLSSKVLFNLLSYLENEEDLLPWFEAFKVMRNLSVKLRYTRGIEYYRFFANSMAKNITKNIGTVHQLSDSTILEYFRKQLKLFLYILNEYY